MKFYLRFFLMILLFASSSSGCTAQKIQSKVRESESFQYSFQSVLPQFIKGLDVPKSVFTLNDSGDEFPIDYSKYGDFQNLGTADYKYKINNSEGLKKALGEGIYPNGDQVSKNPNYVKSKAQGLLDIGHWKALKESNPEDAFFIWAKSYDDNGVKTFFTAKILEKAGLIRHALKAYHSVVVHFPGSAAWGEDGSFVWYVAPAAIGNIKRICRDYPHLDLDYEEAFVDIKNGADTNLKNDIVTVHPGFLVSKKRTGALIDVSTLKILQKRGEGQVRLVQYSNKHWQMLVDDKPFVVRGLSYSPTEVGLGPVSDDQFGDRWMFSDINKNGLIDAPYEAWVDKNRNNKQDSNESSIGDFQLMKEMGVNAIRWFAPNQPRDRYDASLVNKPLLRSLFENYGIRLIVGDFLGAYTMGTDADWESGVDYTNPHHRTLMKNAVRAKVLDLKDEPFVLMWLLGNENNFPPDYSGHNATRTNAVEESQAFAEFVNEVAEMIHQLDGEHPVAIGNLGTGLIEQYNRYAPAVDILGVNSYPGKNGFGYLWQEVQSKWDRPVMLTEFGSDAYFGDKGIDEEAQLRYHQGNLRDIVLNQAGGPGVGNAIGGIIFEYVDEWWKDTFNHPENVQQIKSQYPSSFEDQQTHEEWFGIVGQGNGQNSPFMRHLRRTYHYYKSVWSVE